MFTYTILDNKGRPVAGANSRESMMLIMSSRWAGTLIETASRKVLFDIAADRNCAKQYPNAAERRSELALVETREIYGA